MAIWVRYYYEGGNYEKAITYLEKAVQLGWQEGEAESTYQLAMSYYNTSSRTLHSRYLTR
jgi:TPR repeat protein